MTTAVATETAAREHGDRAEIDDPPPPRPAPRPLELSPLASSGITAERASRELSDFHADVGFIPVDEPLPVINAPPLARRRRT